MSPDGRRRSREHWTDTMEAPPADPPAHVHRLPKVVRIALVGLTVAVFLALVGIGLMAGAVYQANQYVQGRGEFRDREAARMERETDESLRRAICDLLDQFPEGGWLQRPRIKYGCGPGIPVSELTPAEQSQLANRTPVKPSAPAATVTPTPAAPTPAAPTTAAPFSEGAVGPPGTRKPQAPAPTRPPMPTTTAEPTPTSLISPLTDTVCAVIGLCPKE